MIANETGLEGVYLIELVLHRDQRGSFARVFCQKEFIALGLSLEIAQVNTSFNRSKHTLRGMHYQLPPKAETKMVRCTRGAIYDVALDLRPDAPTFGKSFGAELTAENGSMMYIPKGFAHGFMTLEGSTEVFYLIDEFYSPEHERGVRWDDLAFAIRWPSQPSSISGKDAGIPDFDLASHRASWPSTL